MCITPLCWQCSSIRDQLHPTSVLKKSESSRITTRVKENNVKKKEWANKDPKKKREKIQGKKKQKKIYLFISFNQYTPGDTDKYI